MTADMAARELGSDAENGLTDAEARSRLAECGENKLREKKKTPKIAVFFRQLADPMIIILIVAAVVSFVMAILNGGEGIAEVVIIVAVVLLNAVLGTVQESKAENAIAALKELTAAESKVVRGGCRKQVKSGSLVPGDVIVLEAGDSVPADARLIECASLKCEESALTGESVPAEKSLAPLCGDVTLGDRTNMVYSGSTAVYGRAKAVVTATGMNTEMGKIAGVLESAKKERTPLQKKLGSLSLLLTVVVVAVCAVVFVVDLVCGGFSGDNVLGSFVLAVSLAVAAVPKDWRRW